MKKTFTILFLLIGAIMYAQDSTYTALRVVGTNTPVIDGTIDAIWDEVEIVPLTKMPVKPDQNPYTLPDDSADFYAEFGMIWCDTGMFFLFTIVDDVVRIEDDDPSYDYVPNDKWWTDDNVNILFSKDLANATFEQWEFAYQYNINQEEKLSSGDWQYTPARLDSNLVQTAWYNDENLYTLETFINFDCFTKTAILNPGAEDTIQVEMRARDDDDGEGTSWEHMYQWATYNYQVEGTGEGLGKVYLSPDTVKITVGVQNISTGISTISLIPNPVKDMANLQVELTKQSNITVDLFDITGSKILNLLNEVRGAGQQTIPVNISNVNTGCYLLRISEGSQSKVIRLVKM
ncbi:MAG: T9SS type A sorting domain-containing protein [Bacteroidales bacterium]|nr:T9SS type A sorting domain-containing protein [Bacteroidales bacterium]